MDKLLQKYHSYRFVIIALLSILCSFSPGSSFSQNERARYEIDAKRIGVNYSDNDALPRSREFIRLDSTYYVGWMIEGLYKYEKSTDYLGYRNATIPLKKALFLLEKDFSGTLRTFFSSVQADYSSTYKYYDLLTICQALKESYENIEMADSVIWVINRVEAYNFPEDRLHFTTAKAWTYHRNRFYTSSKYSFLKNSIEENEKMALYYCHQAIGRSESQSLFTYNTEKLGAYHNLAIIHAYLKNYDSSEYYYNELQQSGYISYNNYGLLQHEIGNFAEAKQYIARSLGTHYRTLEEPVYYIPILEVYAGRIRSAIRLTKTQITRAGSTPGFGWYNLSLARSYLYSGQLDSSEHALNKAEGFKELHIGTTLTQTQYDFTIHLLRLQLTEKKIALIKFMKKGWWYSPSRLFEIIKLKARLFLQQYVLINHLQNNPERERLVYDLFCNESTTTFDESFYLIKQLSLPYFIKKYHEYPAKDPRLNIHRYFQLFEAKLEWEDGNEGKAQRKYETLLQRAVLDTATEKLFLGRLFEGLAKCYDDNGNEIKFKHSSNSLLEEYPNIIPFSGIKMVMRLNYSGSNDAFSKKAIKELKDCNIRWKNITGVPTVDIAFNNMGNKYEAVLTVKSAQGKLIINQERLFFTSKDENVGKEIALRIFGKGGGMTFQQ